MLITASVKYKASPWWWFSLACPPVGIIALFKAREIYLKKIGADKEKIRRAAGLFKASIVFVAALWLALVVHLFIIGMSFT